MMARRAHGGNNGVSKYVVALFALSCAYFLFSNLRANRVHQRDQQAIANLEADRIVFGRKIGQLEDELLKRNREFEELSSSKATEKASEAQAAPKLEVAEKEDTENIEDYERDGDEAWYSDDNPVDEDIQTEADNEKDDDKPTQPTEAKDQKRTSTQPVEVEGDLRDEVKDQTAEVEPPQPRAEAREQTVEGEPQGEAKDQTGEEKQ